MIPKPRGPRANAVFHTTDHI